MRILMTADAVGGVWNYSLTLSRALSDLGISTVLAVTGPAPGDSRLAVARGIRGLEVHHRPFRLEWMQDAWRDVDAAGEWLLDLERRYRPDVMHINGYAHAALDFGAPKMVVAHSCVCSWWRAVRGGTAPAEWNEYRRRARAGLDRADVVIAPTRAMLDALTGEHGAISRGLVIHNAAPPVDIQLAPAAPKQPFILAAARFDDESKNLRLLESARPRMQWPLRVAGAPDPLPHACVLDLMSRAEIFCHPALYEPFGLAPLEAALSGCALALSDIPSLREIWSGAAMFFDPRDTGAAAATLNALIEDAGSRSRLAAAARARAGKLTPRRQARAYMDAYRAIITFSGRETAFSGAWLTQT